MVPSGPTQSSGLLKQTAAKICQFWTISPTAVTPLVVGPGVATIQAGNSKAFCY